MLPDDQQKKSVIISFAGHELILDAAKALYWPLKKLLVVADLHLEKGSYYAQQGNPLPLYDTQDTLQRLEQLIADYQPRTIMSLGDNIHDVQAFLRMNAENNALLRVLTESVTQWIWLIGNHDRHELPAAKKNMFFCTDYQMDTITFSHDMQNNTAFQIIGHYHPQATVKNMRGRCFLYNTNTLIMPAFGTYAGGLDAHAPVLKTVMGNQTYQIYLIRREKIWRVL